MLTMGAFSKLLRKELNMKSYPSDAIFGGFLLDCMKIVGEAERLANEVEKMCKPKCNDCRNSLTDEEIWERKNNGLNPYSKDILCNSCWDKWYGEQINGKNSN